MTTTRRRPKPRPETPQVYFTCGCVTLGSSFVGTSYCPEAIRLWDKVAAANHNLTQTTKRVQGWPVTTLKMFGPARIKVREAIYEYRRAQYNAHFKVAR